MQMRKLGSVLLVFFFALLFSGCAELNYKKSSNKSSNIVSYLYPNDKNHIERENIPHLNLPLRVGIAFVPEENKSSMVLTEVDKVDIMTKVGQNFEKYNFVKSIDIIPSVYLTKNGGFTNLNQIKNIFNIDIIVLVSFDQTQFTDENFLSLTYWTIIGAYVIPAEKNDTHTMLDAVVYDIDSRKMLFRAPGTHKLESRATLINLSEQLREDSLLSFQESRKELIKNLEIQLELFKNKVKNNPSDYKITKSKGYTGGGSVDSFFVLLLMFIGGYIISGKRKKSE
jgi:rhombotail lipoprotein